MSNNTLSRLGAINGAVSTDAERKALFLKVFAGEVMTTFDVENKILPLTMVRTITNGKSAQFPNVHQFNAAYHTPGTEILGTVANHSETVITIDDLLIAHATIANIDEAMNHYDVRSIYSKELGGALARQMDRHLAQTLVLAARASGTVTGRSGGSVITTATSGLPATPDLANNGSHLAAAMFIAAQILDEKNVPENDRYMLVRPAQYNVLARSTDVINRDWGGSGAYADGTVLRVAGINIVKSNNLPSTNVTNGSVAAGTNDKYAGNFTNTVGVVFNKGAIGTVKLMDMGFESEYQISKQSTLMVAKYAVGHGILRPEAAVEIRNAAS